MSLKAKGSLLLLTAILMLLSLLVTPHGPYFNSFTLLDGLTRGKWNWSGSFMATNSGGSYGFPLRWFGFDVGLIYINFAFDLLFWFAISFVVYYLFKTLRKKNV